MFIKLEKELNELILNSLEKVNILNIKKGVVNNNYIKIIKEGEEISFETVQDKEFITKVNIDKISELEYLFEYRNDFVSEYLKDTKELNIVTHVDLHGHTGYSLLDGMTHVKDFVKTTVYSRAITDHAVMYGCLDFYKKMKDEHKKPIIGFEAYTDSMEGEHNKYHLVLLAKSEIGYKNLSTLSTLGQQNFTGKYAKRATLKYEWIKDYSEGLVCLSACLGGEIPRALAADDYEKAKIVASYYKSIFGEDFYLEVQRHEIEIETKVNEGIFKLGKELGIKVIATSDTHYLKKEHSFAHEVHLCNKTKATIEDKRRLKFDGIDYHMQSIEDMERKFSDVPETLFNSLEVMEKCNFDFKFGEYKLPNFNCPDEKNYIEYLKEISWEGFYERFPIGTTQRTSSEYIERMNFELDTISNMGYPSYFLIVWDFIKFSRENQIPTGPGRGSACGSLIAYALHITDVDPIPYGLLFERFLNPDRKTMPDIDIDFDNIMREEVINYCRKLYGADKVSRIITFMTSSTKTVIRDVSKILYPSEMDKYLGKTINKLIPDVLKISITESLSKSDELNKLYLTNSKVKQIIDISLIIEGLPKATSQHACGVIISDKSIYNYCPQVFLEDDDTGIVAPTTQFTMSECEEIGLLKVDFLGLKNMSILKETVNGINEVYGKSMTIADIPIDDIESYKTISKGKTKGVFQLESPGMTSFMTDLFQDIHSKLKEIEDKKLPQAIKDQELKTLGNAFFERLIAGISLYRPGPIDEIPNFIRNMLDPSGVAYDVPELEDILNVSFGIIIYQEQVMSAVRTLANFSRGQADTIRKAMSKKMTALLDEYKEYFIYGSEDKIDKKTGKPIGIKGCVNLGIDEKIAEKIWTKMDNFSKYALKKTLN